jgi:hypothetical protein
MFQTRRCTELVDAALVKVVRPRVGCVVKPLKKSRSKPLMKVLLKLIRKVRSKVSSKSFFKKEIDKNLKIKGWCKRNFCCQMYFLA